MSDAHKRLERLVPAALLVAITLAAYSNALSPTFQLDDYESIVQNDSLRDPATFLDPLVTYRRQGVEALSRFVAYATFGVDRLLWGLDARGFHLTNVLIHAMAVLLVYALVLELFRTPRLGSCSLAPASREIALLAAVLFAVHPVQTQAVTYVVQRMASLSTALGVAGLLAWLRFRRAKGRRRLAWLAAATIGTAMAMLTKESAFTFPALAVIAEILFFDGQLRGRLLGLVPQVATMAIVPAIVVAGAPPSDRITWGGQWALERMGLSHRAFLFTEARVVASYLRLLLFPAGQNLFSDYPTFRSLSPSVGAAIALHVAAIGGASWIAWISRRRAPERSLVAFGILWFYIALAVESAAVVIPDVYNEHRLYYPTVGAFISAAAAAVLLARRLAPAARARWAGPALAAAVVLALGAATFARNRVWADEVAMWKDVAAKSPALPVVQRMVGVALLRQGRAAEAVSALKRAIGMNPFDAVVWQTLADAYRLSGNEVRSMHAAAAVRYLAFDFSGAMSLWDGAIRRSPGDPALHQGRGIALHALGRAKEAEEELRIACGLGSPRACAGGTRLPDP